MSDSDYASSDNEWTSNMTFTLHLCYCDLFDGLPLTLLNANDEFMRLQASHDPSIETLQDFVDHYADVVAMFDRFAADVVEYVARSVREPARYPAVPERLTPAGLRARLRAMRETITRVVVGVATETVHALWRTYGAEDAEDAEDADRDPDAVFGYIRAFLCAAPRATRRTGAVIPRPARSDTSLAALLRHLRLCGSPGLSCVGEGGDSRKARIGRKCI
jgi:hypothetical protein